jgi:hypothetical protein
MGMEDHRLTALSTISDLAADMVGLLDHLGAGPVAKALPFAK